MGNRDRLEYLHNLIGKARPTMVQEIPRHKSLSFDILMEMVDDTALLKDTLVTKTSIEQEKVETTIKKIYDRHLDEGEPFPTLRTTSHIEFLNEVISYPLPSFFKVLDASHPWMIYWCINSLKLLGADIKEETRKAISSNILSYTDTQYGGIGGGAGQMGHAASTYAAVCSLALSEDKEAWERIDRKLIYEWIMLHLKQDDGSFVMHIGGEVDTRAVYCVLCVASLLDIMTAELIEGVPEWLGKCQTYEGGFGGTPFDEAHGGYTFCAVASLCILGHPSTVLRKYCNLEALTKWACTRQLQLEGGFSGRTNKLVDGCYSHWVGGIMPFLEIATGLLTLCSRQALTNYILMCCQPSDSPGFVDKPGKSTDFYHTNYVLCGLSGAQHSYLIEEKPTIGNLDSWAYGYKAAFIKDDAILDLKEEDKILGLNPIFGLPLGVAEKMKLFYSLS